LKGQKGVSTEANMPFVIENERRISPPFVVCYLYLLAVHTMGSGIAPYGGYIYIAVGVPQSLQQRMP